MRSIGLYLLRQLTLVAMMTAAGLTFAIWLSQSLRLLDIIVNRGLSVGLALKFVALLLPGLLALLLPIAVFIAVMFVYHRLDSDSELVVMRSMGISNLGLARPAMFFAAGATMLAYFLTLLAIPASLREYHDIQARVAGDIAGVVIEAGVFSEVAPGMTFYAQSRDRSGVLSGIIVDDSRNRQKRIIYTATRGAISSGTDGPRAVLENGTYQETDSNGHVSVLYFDHTSVGLTNFVDHGNQQRSRLLEELYLPELAAQAADAADEGQRLRATAEMHRRLAEPLYVFALTLIAVSCLVNGAGPRETKNAQMTAATVGAAFLLTVSFVLRSLAQKSAAFVPTIYLPPILATAAGLWLLVRWRMGRSGTAA